MVLEQPERMSLEDIFESVSTGTRPRRSAGVGVPLAMQDDSVQHFNSLRCMLQTAGDSNKVLYLRGGTGSSPPSAHLGLAQMTPDHTEYCVVIHSYGGPVAPRQVGERGWLVVLEKESIHGLYLSCPTGQTSLQVTDDRSRLSSTDGRLFRLVTSPRGGAAKCLKHVASGKFVSHGSEQLTLVTSSDHIVAMGHLDFIVFPC